MTSSPMGRSNRWQHVESGIEATFVGEDRTLSGAAQAVMEMDDGTPARIDPLALVDGTWAKLPAARGQKDASDV